MENLHQLLINRRSIRKYTEESLNPDDVRLILEAGLMAPTSKSARAWQFVVVEDKEMLAKLSQCKPVAAHPIAKAAIAIVVAIDPTKTEPWIEDASVAAAYMQLQAADLGIGSCWIQVRDRYMADGTPSQEYIQEQLGMPEDMPIICVLTFGYKNEERRPCDTAKLKWENVHIGKWEERE
jgi:nitroreductase